MISAGLLAADGGATDLRGAVLRVAPKTVWVSEVGPGDGGVVFRGRADSSERVAELQYEVEIPSVDV